MSPHGDLPQRATGDSSTHPKPRARWGIRVVFANGVVGFLRHGPVVGTGPIVRFHSRRDAEVNLSFIREGLDEGATASIFKILPSKRS
jgi:hypothetical protein